MRRVSPLLLASCIAFTGAPAALADEAFKPKPPAPDQARCLAMGEGFFAVKGSDACIRINGWVASGVEFGGPVGGARNSALFGGGRRSGVESDAGVSAEARFDTPLGPGRLYVQVGREYLRQ